VEEAGDVLDEDGESEEGETRGEAGHGAAEGGAGARVVAPAVEVVKRHARALARRKPVPGVWAPLRGLASHSKLSMAGYRLSEATSPFDGASEQDNAGNAEDDSLSWAAEDDEPDPAPDAPDAAEFDELEETSNGSRDTLVALAEPDSRSASGSNLAAYPPPPRRPPLISPSPQGAAPAVCFGPTGTLAMAVFDPSGVASPRVSFLSVGDILRSGCSFGQEYLVELELSPHHASLSSSPFSHGSDEQPPQHLSSQPANEHSQRADRFRATLARTFCRSRSSGSSSDSDTACSVHEAFASEQARGCHANSSEAALWMSLAALVRYASAQSENRSQSQQHMQKQQTLSSRATLAELLRFALDVDSRASKARQIRSYTPAREDADRASEAEALLMSGDKENALKALIAGKCYGPALVLARTMDEGSFKRTAASLCTSTCGSGSPMQVALHCLSGQGSALPGLQGTHDGLWQEKAWLRERWRENICAMVASAHGNDSQQGMVALGDSLWQNAADVHAAHVCYAVGGLKPSSLMTAMCTQTTPHGSSSSGKPRLCLLGANHFAQPRTFANATAVRRTEILENVHKQQFPALQPYKLMLAWRHAEVGNVNESLAIAEDLLKASSGKQGTNVGVVHRATSLRDRIGHARTEKPAGGAEKVRFSGSALTSSHEDGTLYGNDEQVGSLRRRASQKLRNAFEGIVSSILGEDEISDTASSLQPSSSMPENLCDYRLERSTRQYPAPQQLGHNVYSESNLLSAQPSGSESNGGQLSGNQSINSVPSDFADEVFEDESDSLFRKARSSISRQFSGLTSSLVQHATTAVGQDEPAAAKPANVQSASTALQGHSSNAFNGKPAKGHMEEVPF